jgi:hypothetical protein
MAKNTVGYFLNTQDYTVTLYQAADGTARKKLVDGDANDSWVYDIIVTSDDTISHDAIFELYNGTSYVPIKYLISPNNILIGQGVTTSNPLRLFQASDGNQITVRYLDRDQNYYIPLPSGCSLWVKMIVAVNTGKTVTLTTFKRNF